jgi:2-deoxy-D-gluconate 3-dehydrogenase
VSRELIQQQFDLTDRVAIVTGGAGLLGCEFCWTLAQAGAAVLVADLDGDAGADVAESITQEGYTARSVATDVTQPDSVDGMVAAALKAWGQVDILVNSAALDPKFDPRALQNEQTASGAFETYPLELWQQALDVNLTGMFLACQAVAEPMLSQGGGTIVNLSSIYGVTAPDQRLYQQDGQPPRYKPVYYTVTKAGVLGLTKYLAAYYAGKHIRVNALTPGGVYNDHDDEFVQAYADRTILGRMADKSDMNGALLFLASDASRYMTGANLVVDGGWTTW